MKIIGFEGCFNDGAFWNYGPAIFKDMEGIIHNAVLDKPVSDHHWERAQETLSVAVIPEPIELGPIEFSKEWTRNRTPQILAYHFDSEHNHILMDMASKEIPPFRDFTFDARKHEGARWLVFRDKTELKRFGRAAAISMFSYLENVEGNELASWHNPVNIVAGLNLDDLEVNDFRRKVSKAMRSRIQTKLISLKDK